MTVIQILSVEVESYHNISKIVLETLSRKVWKFQINLNHDK